MSARKSKQKPILETTVEAVPQPDQKTTGSKTPDHKDVRHPRKGNPKSLLEAASEAVPQPDQKTMGSKTPAHKDVRRPRKSDPKPPSESAVEAAPPLKHGMVGSLADHGAAGEGPAIVRFSLSGQAYGLPVMQVVKALRMVAVTVLPEAPAGMLGAVNYRGEIVPVLDLRQVFDLPSRHIGLSIPILIAQAANRWLGLVVDEVEGVETLPASAYTVSEEISTEVRYVSSVARLEEDLLLMVDLQALCEKFPALEEDAIA